MRIILIFTISLIIFFITKTTLEDTRKFDTFSFINDLKNLSLFQKKIVKVSLENNNYTSSNYLLRSLELKKNNTQKYNRKKLKTNLEKINEIENYYFSLDPNGHLIIRIQEKKPFMLWIYEGKKKYLDRKGVVLKYSNVKDEQLIKIYGKKVNVNFSEISDLFHKQENISKKIKKIFLQNEMSWLFVFDDNKCVDLPLKKLHKIVNVFENIRNLEIYKKFSYFDMRVAERIYLSTKKCLS